MTEVTRTIILPSGRKAEVRKGKGRDLMRAHRAVADIAEPMSVSFALIAELALIDAKALVYEDVLEMELDDVLALEAAVTGVSESRENFSATRGSADGYREPLSAAAITGLIAFGFSLTELEMMGMSELAYWAKATAYYLAATAATDSA
jgi:hypothetical protein